MRLRVHLIGIFLFSLSCLLCFLGGGGGGGVFMNRCLFDHRNCMKKLISGTFYPRL